MPQILDQDIGPIGFGLMSLTWRAEPIPTSQAIETCKTALAKGATFWNGGEFYGSAEYNSLHVMNRYFTENPQDADRVFLSIKGGHSGHGPDGTKENIRRSVDECLKLLDGKKKLDLFEPARLDGKTPLEETIGALAEYVKAGKIGGIGLSEVSAQSIEKAAAIHKIAAVEVEFSLFETTILENGVAAVCAKLGIPIVAYSPLGRGFLTGQIKTVEDVPGNLKSYPRFLPENFDNNMKLVNEVEKLAKSKNASVGQVAISWVKAQSGRNGLPMIVPIPGTTTSARVEENMTDVALTEADLELLDEIVKNCTIVGDRYPGAIDKWSWG